MWVPSNGDTTEAATGSRGFAGLKWHILWGHQQPASLAADTWGWGLRKRRVCSRPPGGPGSLPVCRQFSLPLHYKQAPPCSVLWHLTLPGPLSSKCGPCALPIHQGAQLAASSENSIHSCPFHWFGPVWSLFLSPILLKDATPSALGQRSSIH